MYFRHSTSFIQVDGIQNKTKVDQDANATYNTQDVYFPRPNGYSSDLIPEDSSLVTI